MKNILVFVFVSIFTLPALAQGAWNIKYIPITQVTKSLIGSEIRIDFKSTADDHATDGDHIRQKLLNRDTITLNVAGESRRLIESWRIYVDHGVLSEQALKDRSDGNWLVREIMLRHVGASLLSLDFHIYDGGKKRIERVDIQKTMMKGVLVEN